MPANLPKLNPDPNNRVELQNNTFTLDGLARYICSTYAEATTATQNTGGFDAVVIGSGMYGAYAAAKLFQFSRGLPRRDRPRILVLEEGPFFLSEHFQNYPVGLGGLFTVPLAPLVPDAQTAIAEPGRYNAARRADGRPVFTPHHKCVGGKSLFWGGWTPRYTVADLEDPLWPREVVDFLNSGDGYAFIEREIGSAVPDGFIFGTLYKSVLDRAKAVLAGTVGGLDGFLTDGTTIDRVLPPPIAVKVTSQFSGLFSPNKFSSLPILIEALRDAAGEAGDNDAARRLFLVPRAKVLNLVTDKGRVVGIDIALLNPVEPGNASSVQRLTLKPSAQVILAGNAINSTRLALNSFPRPAALTPERMGANLMVHVRDDYLWQVRRDAVDPALVGQALQAAALHVEGTARNLGSGNRVGRFHFQFYATTNSDSTAENFLYQLVPNEDELRARLAALKNPSIEWLTFGIRTCCEYFGDPDAPVGAGKPRSNTASYMDASPFAKDAFGRAESFVKLVDTPEAQEMRQAARAAAFAFVAAMANTGIAESGRTDDNGVIKYLPGATNENGLATTYHECGTLWMGDDPERSVTDANGRFHHVANAYCADQALFPTGGSANPVPTGLALARKMARSIVARYETAPEVRNDPGFTYLFGGTIAPDWSGAGAANFAALTGFADSAPILQAGQFGFDSVLGLLWFTPRTFKDFVLRLEWKSFAAETNAGIFLRTPQPPGPGQPLTNAFYDACTEVQIDESAKNFAAGRNPQSIYGGFREKTGAVYQIAPATRWAAKAISPRQNGHPGYWNAMEITAQGNRITVVLNGVTVCEATVPIPAKRLEGFLALQCHTDVVQFRNIRIKNL